MEDDSVVVDDHGTSKVPVIELHLYHHFTDPLSVNLTGPVTVLTGTVKSPAVGAKLIIKEKQVAAATLTVDTVNEIATLEIVDDKGDTNATQPAGSIVTFTSDNPAALTIAADPSNPLQGDITVVGEGVSNVGATITDASGNPLLLPDGVTPWASIGSVAVTVNPGAGVGAVLSVSP